MTSQHVLRVAKSMAFINLSGHRDVVGAMMFETALSVRRNELKNTGRCSALKTLMGRDSFITTTLSVSLQ